MGCDERRRRHRPPPLARLVLDGMLLAGMTAAFALPISGAESVAPTGLGEVAQVTATKSASRVAPSPNGRPPAKLVAPKPTEPVPEPSGQTPAPTSPSPEPSGTTPTTGEPTPSTPSPATTPGPTPSTSSGPTVRPPAPSQSPTRATPPGRGGPANQGGPRLGVWLTTGDIVLTNSYWNAPSTVTDLNVIVVNTGQVAQRIALTYTLPAGVSDAGTPGCGPVSGSTYRCGAITAAADASRSVHIRLRIGGGAWRNAPLNGSLQATATGSGRGDLGIARDYEGFAVLFPPGPPVAGMGLAATEVRFTALDKPATLQVTLTNRGRASAVAAVDVALPSGVNAAAQAGCVPAGTRIRCDLGPLPAGRSGRVRMTLSATPEAQRHAPLSGAAFGTLSGGGKVKSTQTSFRILADAATPAQDAGQNTTATGVAASSASSSGVTATALGLILAAGALVVLAVVLATTSLLRRREDDPGAPGPGGLTRAVAATRR